MAIEMLNPNKPEDLRAIEILTGVIVQGNALEKGQRVRVPAADAFDLVHAKQAKFLKPEDLKDVKR